MKKLSWIFLLVSIVNFCFAKSNPEELYIRGIEKYLNGDLEGSYKEVFKAYKEDKTNKSIKEFLIKVLFKLAVNKVEEKDYSHAFKYIRIAREVAPEDENVAKCYLILQDLKDEKLSIKKDVKEIQKLNVRKTKHKMKKQKERSTKKKGKIDQKQEKQKKKLTEYYYKALDAYKRGEYKKAIKYFEKVLAINPQHQHSREVIEKVKQKLKDQKN